MQWTSIGLATALVLGSGAAYADYTMEQQNACMGDAFCVLLGIHSEPGRGRPVHARRHRNLSRRCRIVFDASRPNSHPNRSYGANQYPNQGYRDPETRRADGSGIGRKAVPAALLLSVRYPPRLNARDFHDGGRRFQSRGKRLALRTVRGRLSPAAVPLCSRKIRKI